MFKEGTIHCLVMDFVPGENLFEAVKRRGALPEAEIVRCIRQIGEALVVVHHAGLVHRDAHPGNIMLRSNGKAVLIDFGIAKELVPKTLSSKGIAGHEGFAPYEQMSRGSRDPTVDVYCLVATLYYGVTGQRPTTSLARKLDNTFLIPPKQINPSISDQLNQAILKGMALEAKDRPQSMQVWLTMLATKSRRIIPWDWLVGVIFSYLLIAYLLAAFKAPYIVWIVAWAVAVGGAVAGIEAWTVVGVWAVAGVWAVTWAVAVTWAMAVTWAVIWAVASAGEKLQKSFSKLHTFLILASTCSLGLSLGWLGHKIFNTDT